MAARQVTSLLLAVLFGLAVQGRTVSPVAEKILAAARHSAKVASLQAETKLLAAFGEPAFRVRLSLESPGGRSLASKSPQELLQLIKAALASLEYTHNFGLDPVSRRMHPGVAAINTSTIDEFGFIPTDWQLRAARSPVIADLSVHQWGIEDAAETGVYGLPEFQDPQNPSAAEVADRPMYLAGNLRRMDLGIQRYGAFAALVRNDVVRTRAVLAGADSGGWVSGCNDSIVPVHEQSWWTKLFERSVLPCSAIANSGLGVLDHQLHTLHANTESFHLVGGGLPRVIFQLLAEGATARPLEVNMYTEAAVFGPLAVSDLKLLVADFAGIFGTEEGKATRDFCKRHRLPLAWGLGAASIWPEVEARSLIWLPFEDIELWPAGRARLMDPQAGWPHTNITREDKSEDAVWEEVWAELFAARANGAKVPRAQFIAWWTRLQAAAAAVTPLGAEDCASSDLCFGTFRTKSGSIDCACRTLPPPTARLPTRAAPESILI